MSSHGLTVERQEVEKGRFNILAYPGDSAATDVLVSSHIDTVPPYWKYEYHKSKTDGEVAPDARDTSKDTM